VTWVNCNLTLEPNDTVTKRLIFQGPQSSGVTLDCNGAAVGLESLPINLDAIEVRSLTTDEGWSPVHDVTIKNCNVLGAIRIHGMGKNGNDPDVRESSRTLEHVYTVRDNAPYNIVLDNLTITAKNRVQLYFAPGVHNSSLINSEVKGDSISVRIYLGAETYGNTIDGNILRGPGVGREIIAVDASSHNIITNNRLLNAPQGGIYLYRNCGESGTIRHTTPSHNEISNNEINCSYNVINWFAAVYLGSRDGNRGYCDDDKGYLYGSSVSDQDHARFNEVTGNDLDDCEVKTGNETNHSNTIN
jgi:parallel beta-helix repeat protein